MSVQIGLKRENPFLLDRMGIVQSVLDPATLERELLRFMVDRIRPMYKLDCTQNAVENIILQVEKCLWQSSQ
jgi:hypothetical protein